MFDNPLYCGYGDLSNPNNPWAAYFYDEDEETEEEQEKKYDE